MIESFPSAEYDREDALDAAVTVLVEIEPILFALGLGALDSIDFEKVSEAARLFDRIADLHAGENVATESGPDTEEAALLADLVMFLRHDSEFRAFDVREIADSLAKLASMPVPDHAWVKPDEVARARQFVVWLLDALQRHEDELLK